MKYYIIILFTAITFAHNVQAQDLHNLKEEVEKLVELDYELQLDEAEGFWIGVIDSDSTFIFKIGNLEADSLAQFQLGSISKVFTYRSFEKLITKHDVSREDALSQYLDFNKDYQTISLEDLSNHTSGLPKEPFFFGKRSTNPDNPYESYPKEIIVDELNNHSNLYSATRHGEFTYGHLNYALLGLTMEVIANEDYCDILEKDYLASFPSLICSDRASSLVLGFDKAGYPILPWQFPSFESSEGLSSNIIDLTNFVRGELNKSEDNSKIYEASKYLDYQAPWYVLNTKRSQKTHSFSGTTSGHSVFICFDKNSETAVVMMRNSGKGILHLPMAILEMVKSSKAKSK